MTEEEAATLFKCTIRDFSASVEITGAQAPSQCFQLQEMGPNGTGSLENGDASEEIWWMAYPERV
jgi:hypothetical protein